MSYSSDGPKHPYGTESAALEAALRAWTSPEALSPLDDRRPPRFDTSVKTEFLRRTIARAVTPRAGKRVFGLRQMEPLLARQEAGFPIGVAGHLLGSIARVFPVSHRAMRLELRGRGVQHLVEVAEQIELGLWAAPYRAPLPREDGDDPEGDGDL
jgi:hypothetical protein